MSLHHPSHSGHCHNTRDTRPFSSMPVSLVCCRPKWHRGAHRAVIKAGNTANAGSYEWNRPDGPTR